MITRRFSNCLQFLCSLSFSFKRFLVATAQTAAERAKAFIRTRDIERQLRTAFQASQVDKEPNVEEAHLPKAKRSKHAFDTTSSEDEEGEEPQKKKTKKNKGGPGKKSKPADDE